MQYQCIFQENTIEFWLSDTLAGIGYIALKKIYSIFKIPDHIKLYPRLWYHTCVSYDGDRNSVIMTLNNDIVINKTLLQWGNFSMEGDFQIGFCKNSDTTSAIPSAHGKLDPLRVIFRGAVLDFHVWSRSLKLREMLEFTAKCADFSDTGNEGDLINWNSLVVLKTGSASVNQTVKKSSSVICPSPNGDRITLIIDKRQTYSNAKLFCSQLGGQMPMFRKVEDFEDLRKSFYSRNRFDKKGMDMLDACSKRFWVPVIQRGKDNTTEEYVWIEDGPKENDRDKNERNKVAEFLPWSIGQPNGFEYERCVILTYNNKRYFDVTCERKYCSFCSFDNEIHFTLRGLKESSDVDSKYIFLPRLQKRESFVFMGHLDHYIIFYMLENNMEIWDVKTNRISGYHNGSNFGDENPSIGAKKWKMLNEYSKLYETSLKFSQVFYLYFIYFEAPY